jgi:hypothetical protein
VCKLIEAELNDLFCMTLATPSALPPTLLLLLLLVLLLLLLLL